MVEIFFIIIWDIILYIFFIDNIFFGYFKYVDVVMFLAVVVIGGRID